MNEPPKSNSWAVWLKALLGCIIGAVAGGVAAVFIAGFLFFIVYPMFVKVNWDSPGLGFLPILAAPIGIIIGAVVGASLAIRRL